VASAPLPEERQRCRDQHQFEEASEPTGRRKPPRRDNQSIRPEWWHEWIQIQLERIWNFYWQGLCPLWQSG